MTRGATNGSGGERAVVIGAGAAGAAAVFAAERAGWSVTWIDGGAGATALTSGALDFEPWEQLSRAIAVAGTSALVQPRALIEARAFVDALGIWELPKDRVPMLVTTAGVVRPARGFDKALLDLSALRGRTVLVPRVDRAQWDADWLARSWSEGARGSGVGFSAVDVPVLRYEEESRVADGELARRHDDPARLAWLVDRLAPVVRANGREGTAILLGPWLGVEAPRASELTARLGVPVGEALSGTAGTAGLRFEAARARVARGEILEATVARVENDGSALRVVFAGERPSIRARRVIVATGGLIAGNLAFVPPNQGAGWDGAESVRPAFRQALEAPDLEPFVLAGSMHGPFLDETAWPRDGRAGALEAAGARASASADPRLLTIVGDARRGAPRTMIEAIASGLSAFAPADQVAPADAWVDADAIAS
ncbi:MAG: hypothetical protein U0414_30690 [Polyangiaceae bacterium]